MEKEHLSRKLAVILHADVVGSTSLVHENETLAHERIQTTFHNFSETIKSYGGNTREIRGDALVAEFERTSDAVTAALAFQALNEITNSAIQDKVKPYLRIGISLGEVVMREKEAHQLGSDRDLFAAQRVEQVFEGVREIA